MTPSFRYRWQWIALAALAGILNVGTFIAPALGLPESSWPTWINLGIGVLCLVSAGAGVRGKLACWWR